MQENKNSNWLQPILYGFILIVGIVLGVFLKGSLSVGAFSMQSSSPIEEMMEIVKSRYVDSLATDSLEQKVADYYLSNLDPHSVYIPPVSLSEVNEQLTSNYRGIGIEFQQFRDSVFVSFVIKEGPAYKAGLKVGDILLKVNDTIQLSGKKWDGESIRKKIKGPAESNLNMQILRGQEVLTLQIKRDNVPTSSVDAAYMINDTLGYIKIDRFADRTYEAFMQALDPMVQKGMKALVIDLRGNGGGLLSEAVAIADELISGNKLIVYTQGLHAPRTEYTTKREGLFENGKLTVLMDETSASASEILAGALQDWDRAKIVGRTSFGKGLVQQQFRLSNGGALRLTVAKYYTPLGRNIQRSYAKGKMAYEHDFMNRMEFDAQGKVDSSLKGKAFRTPKGHVVYDGGGIYPDHWVTVSMPYLDSNFQQLMQQNLINDFSFRWYLQHKKELDSFTSVQAYIKANEKVDIWSALNNYASAEQKKMLSMVSSHKLYIRSLMLANMARFKWYKQGYYEVLNALDPQFASTVLLKD
jgi:carboxyl-terminal processing protease